MLATLFRPKTKTNIKKKRDGDGTPLTTSGEPSTKSATIKTGVGEGEKEAVVNGGGGGGAAKGATSTAKGPTFTTITGSTSSVHDIIGGSSSSSR